MSYDFGNTGSGLGHAEEYGGIKLVNIVCNNNFSALKK